MMITVTPEAFSQFGPSGESFCLVTDEAYVEGFHIAPGGGYRDYRRLALPAGMDLPEMLNRQVPEDAHVLVVCPDRFLSSPSAEEISGRRLAIMPAGSTPLTWEQVRYFLTVAERNDAAGHAKAADAFFDAVEQCPSLRIVDAAQGTEAVFDHLAGDYAWNQQAGELAPGEQQILPAGELSVLPVDITGFDPDARLALNGSLTLRGWPIVHRYDAPEDLADQRRLFGDHLVMAGLPE